MPKLKTGGRLPIGTKSQYDNVVSIYQSLVSKGVDPQAALDLVNQKVAEKGWTGYATGDNKKFNNVDQFTDHLIDWHSRMYPDSLKAKNFNDYWKGIMITPKNKYNPRGDAYKKELLLTRPGVKKRINFYRKQQGLNPLALVEPNNNLIQKGQKGFKTINAALQYTKNKGLDNYGVFARPQDIKDNILYVASPLQEIEVVGKTPENITTIKLNNGFLTYNHNTFKWYRNNKPLTEYSRKYYKYYDPSIGLYRTLDDYGLATPYTPYFDKLMRDSGASESKSSSANAEFNFDPENHITLRTNGKMNLVDIPTNVLDSIAINTGRSNTDIKTNLGLVGKESTFGGYSKALGKPLDGKMSQYDLVNNHASLVTPEYDYLMSIFRTVPSGDPKQMEQKAKEAYEHNLIKPRTKQYYNNYLADSFARYADNPSKYNSGQQNYVQMVNNIANEVWNDPQIKKWWKTEGINYYNKGLQESK